MATVPIPSSRASNTYPTSDGRPLAETDLHRKLMVALIETLELYFARQPRTYVSGNLLLFYERGNRRRHVAPDVFVVKGVSKQLRPNYLLWEEGHGPQLVIELTSSSTRHTDQQRKYRLYQDVLRVREYFLFDPLEHYLEPPLQGYRLRGGRYRPIRPDEVKVHAQACTGQKEVLTYTAVVLLAGCCWHLTARTAQDLVQQTAGLLATLGVAEGRRRLLFLADGARWIRDWFEALAVAGKARVLCCYPLVKRCEQALSLACRGRQHRAAVQEVVLRHLWHGRVDEALAVLRSRRGEMKNEQALEDLLGYVEARRPYLPD